MSSILILFVFGAIVGSFLNVLGTRWNSGMTLRGRSFCLHCGKRLNWHELVPILSFLFLRGRCSRCRAKISWQYPAVEVLTGLVFATIYNLEFSIFNKFLLLSIFSIYIVILIYDLRHKIIPDAFVYPAIVLSILNLMIVSDFELRISSFFPGLALFAFFASLWLLTRGRAVGFGDSKLAASIGFLLGASNAFSAVILAFWIGASVGILLMIFGSKKITMKTELPFAPFLVVGAWLALIFNLDLLHVASL